MASDRHHERGHRGDSGQGIEDLTEAEGSGEGHGAFREPVDRVKSAVFSVFLSHLTPTLDGEYGISLQK